MQVERGQKENVRRKVGERSILAWVNSRDGYVGYYSSKQTSDTCHPSPSRCLCILTSHFLSIPIISPLTHHFLCADAIAIPYPRYRSSLGLASARTRANAQAIQHRHPYEDVRDTALYCPLRKLPNVKVTSEGQYPSLKTLCREVLGMKEGEFQKGEHCPVSLARRSRCYKD